MKIKVDGVVSRGVKRCYISDKGHLIFVMTDNERIDLGKVSGTESGSGDMLSFIYDPEEGLRQVAFKDQLHTHTNKLLLDTYTQTEADLSDAVSKKHSHENGDVLDRITDDVYGSIESTIRQTATNTTNIRTNSIDIRTNASDIARNKEQIDNEGTLLYSFTLNAIPNELGWAARVYLNNLNPLNGAPVFDKDSMSITGFYCNHQYGEITDVNILYNRDAAVSLLNASFYDIGHNSMCLTELPAANNFTAFVMCKRKGAT